MSSIQVIFNNSLSTYYSGDKVSATIIINVDQPKKVREINVKFLGVTKVRWTEFQQTHRHRNHNTNGTGTGVHSNSQTESVVYSGEETLFESLMRLCGESTLPIGRHTYDVAGFLPPNVPGSFEGEHGHVRYTLKVTMVRPWAFDDELIVPFTVIYPVDISGLPAARERLMVENSKTVGCCCWKSGPLSATMHAPLSGYLPNQAIPVTVAIENLSNANVTNAVASVYKIITCTAKYPSAKSKVDTTEIATVQFGQIGAHGEVTWTKDVHLPNNLHATNTVSSMIKISYELKLNTTVSKSCSYGISLSAPVIICSTSSHSQQPPDSYSTQYAPQPAYYPPSAVPVYPPSNASAPAMPYPQESYPGPSAPNAPPPPYDAVVDVQKLPGWNFNQ